MELVRLQKFLANSGVCSRRNAEQLILDGKIKVNGIVVSELGLKIDIEKDVVTYNNKEVKKIDKKIYILLNKPIGYVTTVKEQFGRPTVIDLVKEVNSNLLPVGRLDMYTSGAIILTNDGDFINKVTHPRNEVNKTYNATVRGIVTDIDIHKLENGVEIDNYISGKAKVKILKIDKKNNISRIQIIIHEGKNREVRKMCAAINKNVIALHRSKIAEINVADLKIGEWRYLNSKEVEMLSKHK
ncbi:MAG: rRNA pseudouridine synthase [Clostridiales bacterium]|nr:rRNA pseudouridine synthase [Clostridiales bacterium]